MHSYICIVASQLGTIDALREGRDIGAKPEDDIGGRIPKIERTRSTCLDRRYSPSGCHFTNTGLVLSQASPGA